MAFARLIVVMLIPLAVIYASLLAWLCARRRDRLEEEFNPAASPAERRAFVQAGVRAYAARIRGRLAAAVFGIPIAGLIGYVLVTNGI
jgi:hypothetical protein